MTKTGTPVIATYEFTPAAELPFDQFIADNALKKAVRQAAAQVEAVAGIILVEVKDAADAMISISYNTDPDGISWANYPFSNAAYPNSYGELTMNDTFDSFAKGTFGFEILLHEFGHALGLKHPFDDTPKLAPNLDNTSNTVMSYTVSGGPKSTYQQLDKEALRALYGPARGLDGVSVSFSDASSTLRVVGTSGTDKLIGVNDDSKISGAGGADILFGRDGYDRLVGDGGDDVLNGLWGDDTLIGGQGNDRMRGGERDDRLLGGHGDDRLFGEEGDDQLIGGSGSERMFGGPGRDTLSGGGGSDEMRGDKGADVFALDTARGTDRIIDFRTGQGDRIDVSKLGYDFADIVAAMTPDGADMVIDTGGGRVVIVGGANMDFHPGDFIF
ncbi:matrixin family metalloprotease [Acuticoccus kandeliae]|uniref:matrixin family metalloprotease n=1 Tax=Acuticoccus kandeliae TaxID=2073160 RepID=UPI0013001FAB|nr:matrixin family metalloprotease [Acuticoccus kandeliae]